MFTPPTAAPTSRPVPRSAMFIVFIVAFIDLLGFGIVLPVMPRQAEVYLADQPPAVRDATIGILFSVFSLMQFVFSPVWGRVSDRIGRKPVLIISLLGSVVFYALYGYAVTIPASHSSLALILMFVSRIGAGIAGASVGTAAAVIADCTTPEKRAKGMALIGIAFGGGFTLGPLIAYGGLALFADQPWGVGALASGLSFAALLFAIFLFRETRNPSNKAGKDIFSISRTITVLSMPTVGTLILIYFLAIFAFANFEATLARLTGSAFGMTQDDNFLVFACVGAVLTVAGGLYRPLVKNNPEARLLRVGISLMILGLGGVGIVAYESSVNPGASNPVLRGGFFLALGTSVVGFAFVNPSVSSLVSRRSDPARQGEVIGVNQAFASLGRILGPFLGNMLFGLSETRALPYVAAVGLLLLVVILLPRVRATALESRQPTSSPA